MGQWFAGNAAIVTARSPWISPKRLPRAATAHHRYLFTGEKCFDAARAPPIN
jgi:hypothetical protein